jgi:hypothetical protein
MYKLVEEVAGRGELSRNGTQVQEVGYRISRFQAQLGESGLPVPGVYRLEGTLEFEPAGAAAELIGVPLTLRLEDGRAMDVTVTDPDGQILTEGRHPRGCSCC